MAGGVARARASAVGALRTAAPFSQPDGLAERSRVRTTEMRG